MTHDELLTKVNKELELAIFEDACGDGNNPAVPRALLAVVELHKPTEWHIGNIPICSICEIAPDDDHNYSSKVSYPCLTIQVIEKELN